MVLALCGAKLGEPEKALTLVAKAESLHADDMDSQLYKVRALELAGRRDAAMAAIVRCLSRGASPFQFDSMPDLERLRATPEYKSMMANATAANLASL
jgi:hypothetical protein